MNMQQKKTEVTEHVPLQDGASTLRELLQSLTRYIDAVEQYATQGGECVPASYAQALMIMLNFDLQGVNPTLSELVDLLNIDKSNVTRLCQRMKDSGHIAMTRDDKDRRAKRIKLTDDGRDLGEFIQSASVEKYNEVLAHFEQEQHRVLFEQLMTLNDSFNKVI